ncbi:OPT family oligopeptide transporter [soil metagenome]
MSAPVRQLTLRAGVTGAVLGTLLVPCNVYSGLKIGWSFNMSIAAALLSYGFWGAVRGAPGGGRVPVWGMLENNANQTCASSAASIISAGLVAPIPALTILSGTTLAWPALSAWLFSVSLLGVVVAVALRRQMLVVEGLPFPSGVATAETVREIYAQGREAALRVRYLLAGGAVAAGAKVLDVMVGIAKLGPALSVGSFGATSLNLRNLGFVFDPSFLMIGFGAIVGLRVGVSLLLGAVLAWGVLAPWLFASGRVAAADPEVLVFGAAIEWLLWPGVALMVCAALTGFVGSLPGIVRGMCGRRAGDDEPEAGGEGVPRAWLFGGFVVAATIAVVAQVGFFGIHPAMAVLAVLLTFVLAVVAARVSGETGIPPIGALGKITQLTFGLIHPTSVSTNLMTANVTGGAAGQCSDLLHDLKAGRLLGASVRAQSLAQVLGVAVGSLAGSAAYLVLVPDPAGMLLTEEWPAPAVATWMAVAELFRAGVEAVPQGAWQASVVAAVVGIALALVGPRVPARRRFWVPSPVSMGLAFVLPAFNSISLFLGAALAAVVGKVAPDWARRFVLPVAAGLVAGESLAGVGAALWEFLTEV